MGLVPRATLRRVGWGVVLVGLAAIAWLALRPVIGALAFALFVYYATRPLYRRLDAALDHPNLTATLTLLAFVLPVLLIVAYASLVALRQLADLLSGGPFAEYRTLVAPLVNFLGPDLETLFERVTGRPDRLLNPAVRRALRGALGDVRTVAGVVFGVALRVFLVFAFAFYLLRDDDEVGDWVRATLGEGALAVRTLERIDEDLERLFVGNAVTILLIGTVATLTYNALNLVAPLGIRVPHAVLFGLVTGVATLVPAVGIKIAYYPLAGYLFYRAATTPAPLWFPVVFIVVTQIVVDVVPDVFVRSWIASGRHHMGLVLFAYVLGSIAFGWAGVFLGPIALVALTTTLHVAVPELTAELREGSEA